VPQGRASPPVESGGHADGPQRTAGSLSGRQMAHRFINELKPGEQLADQVFLIQSKDLRSTTQGSLYIHLVLTDRTGQVLARIWQASKEMFNTIPEGGFLRIRGRTENYKGTLQFIVEGLQPIRPEDVDLADFLPCTERDVEEMWERTKAILRNIKDRHVLLLVKQFIQDDALMAGFKRAPAALQMHHSYLGGLLEHTLNVLELGALVAPRYPSLSQDLVLAGIFLHDLGKTSELAHETNIAYTDSGQLVGHIVQCAIWLDEKVAAVEAETGEAFPREIRDALQHVVLSHHGKYEFGSPRLPATPEAMLVHLLDNIDAKLDQYLGAIESDPDEKSHWTQYVRPLETRIFKLDVMKTRGKRT
jgi:3'-5' exoribonuclease